MSSQLPGRELPVRDIQQMPEHYAVTLTDDANGAGYVLYVERKAGEELTAEQVVGRARERFKAPPANVAPPRLVVPRGSKLFLPEGSGTGDA